MLIIMQKRMVALQLCSTLFSGFFRSVAFLPQALRSQTICFRHSRRAPSLTLLCTGTMPSGQLFSICIVCRLMLRALRMYNAGYHSAGAQNSRLRTIYYYHLARKRDNRQSDVETIGKTAVRQDVSNCCFTPAQGAASSLCNCSTCLHKVRTHIYINIYIYILPPHSASCSSASGVCAPVGGRKKTTSASCNRLHHHRRKECLCKWLKEKCHQCKLQLVTITMCACGVPALVDRRITP